MESVEQLQQLYGAYLEEAEKARKAASPFDGLFGLGNDPRKHPCHDAFYKRLQAWIGDFIATGPSGEAARAVAEHLLEAPARHRETEGYWYMFAGLGFLKELIPSLSKADCKALAARMNTLYPRRERLPLQQAVFNQLTKAGK